MITQKQEVILIVDDQEENLRGISNVLKMMAYDTILARSAKQAFEQLSARPPDLILLDVMMPETDGLTTCRQIKANDCWADIPIIFLSADDDKNVIVQALETGGVDYVTKPFNMAELVSRVRTQLALKRAKDQLRALVEDKDEIIGILAHDLKNSLAGMRLSASLLQTRLADLPPRCAPLVENIVNASERMLSFMQEFLANQCAEQLRLKSVAVNLSHVAAKVAANHQPAAGAKKITLTTHAPKAAAFVNADPEGLAQALENLVSNAIKFSPEGGAVKITVEPPLAGMVKCFVHDTGPGFTPEDRTKMFRRYGRLSAQPTGDEPSTGLGLSIVKRLVEAMAGTVILSENSGVGAEFVITLQAANPKPVAT